MELRNDEIFGAMKALEELFNMDLPVRTSIAMAKLIGKINEAYQAIDKVRTGLVNKYGESDEKTRQTTVKPDSENFPKFMEEYNELMSQKTELVIEKVKLPQNVNGNPVVVKPLTMMSLEKFIELEPLTVVK